MSLLDLQNINGDNGLIIPGKIQDDRLGTEVYSAGDINGDGIEDLIVTATNAGTVNSDPDSYSYSDKPYGLASQRQGRAYVIFGSQNGYDTTFDLNNLNGNNGFRITGVEENHELGNAISAGDINGDGVDDLVVGASYAGDAITNFGFTYSNNKGEVYVIFGRQNSFAADFSLQSLNGSNGFRLRGIDAEDLLGTAIASAGDINGDGINDLAISAAGAGKLVTNNANFTTSDRRGEVFVVFGKKGGFNSPINLALLNGSNGFIIEGQDPNDSLGAALSNAGDINGDDIDDLIIGSPNAGKVLNSPFANGDSDQRGEVQVIFGSRNRFNARFNVGDRPNSVQGFTISGIGIEDNLGSAVSNAGDLNGDGIDDLILGAANASVNGEYTQEGQVYVVFGRQGSFGNQFDLNSLNGNNGFSITGINPGDGLGNAVTVGDFNGDGIDDLLIGANNAGQRLHGEVYIIFGKQDGFTPQVDLANLNRNAGTKIVGVSSDDLLGSAISSGGDINNDGADDLIVSAPNVDLRGEYTREGTAYVVFGSRKNNPPTTIGTPFPDNLVGGSGNDTISGDSGADTITGNNGNDLLNGGSERDSLFGGQGSDTLNGDNNGDTLFGGDNNDLLNGNQNQDRLFGESGNDTLIGGPDNDQLFGGQGNDTLNGSKPNSLELQLGEQDTLVGGAGRDLFVLGDQQQVYYDDRNSNTEGSNDYALIEDFNPQQDQIQLKGDKPNGMASQRNSYKLSFFTGSQGNTLANIFYIQPGATPERVGIINNVSPQLTLNDSAFIFLGSPDNSPNPQAIFGTPYQDNLVGGSGDDTISGDSGADTIAGNNGNDLLNGGSERDSLFGGQGSDTLNGDNNGDTLLGGDNNDLLNGNQNQDWLFGQSGNDTLIGGPDNDQLFGGQGNDTLNGSKPNSLELQLGEQDTLVGGAGRDLFVLGDQQQVYYDDRNSNTEGSNDYALIEDFNPQQDQIQLKGSRNSYKLSFFTGSQGNTLANIFYLQPGAIPERVGIINNAPRELTLDDAAFIYLSSEIVNQPSLNIIRGATPYNDQIKGSTSNDLISGDKGDDTLSGGDGNDSLAGDDGGDSLFGDSGNDTIDGGNNGDTMFGAAGNDLLFGGNNQDQLVGDEGNDTLIGGTDKDLLIGGLGNDILVGADPNNFELQLGEQDTLIGGSGADLFILGDENQIYYDDRNPNTEGSTDYAVIQDFNSQQDRIQLKGDRSSYELSFFTGSQGNTSANIFYQQPGSKAERVGIIDNASPTLTIDNSAFTFI